MDRAPFTFGSDTGVFGKKIKLESSALMRTLVLELIGDGLMDFHGHIMDHKVTEMDRRRLWKYIQYLWMWNPGHTGLAALTKPNGTADADSFATGVRTTLGLSATEVIPIESLVSFINDTIVDEGVVHPVLTDLHTNLRKIAPLTVMVPRVVAADPANPGKFLDLPGSFDEDTSLVVKVT